MADRNKCTLQELTISINTGLDAIRRAPIVEKKTDIRCLRIQDISQCKSFEKWGYTEVIKKDFEKFQLITDDIIMARTCSTGICYLVKENIPAVFNNGLARIRLDKEKAYPQFMYYVFKSKHFTDYIDGISRGTSVQLNMKIGDLEKYEFNLPDLENQKKIAYILGKYDDKIHLNIQTNQTLEAIAQAIFKSWFVDFDPVRAKAAALSEGKNEHEANLAAMSVICGKDTSELSDTEYSTLWQIAEAFPSEFGDEGLPIGWKFNQAGNLFDVGIGKTPPRKESEWFSDNANDTEWISIKDMGNQGLFITESSEYLKVEAVDKFNIKRIPKNTVILSFKLTVGRVSITTKETTTNEAIAHFKIPSSSNLSSEFLYCYLKNFDFNNLGSTSSIATAVNSKMIKEMEILEPSDLVINHFNEYIEGIFNKIKENIIQNNNLTKIRDELLPKLLNGELFNE